MPAVQPVCVKLCVCAYIYVGKMSLILLTDVNCTTSVSHTTYPWMDKCRYTIKPDYISTCACMARWHNVYIIGTSL